MENLIFHATAPFSLFCGAKKYGRLIECKVCRLDKLPAD